MASHSFSKSSWIFAVPLILILAVAAACGGAEPPSAGPTAAASVPNTPVPENTEPPAATIAPTAVVVPSSVTVDFPLEPAWTSGSKFQPMVLQQIGRNAAGQWDVHACSSLYSCNIPSSKRFNGLVEYNPVNPTGIIGDLASGWEVNAEAGSMSTPSRSTTPPGMTASR